MKFNFTNGAQVPRLIPPRLSRLLRRLHMYLGLLLLPWVLLYGITALLFNHSTWATDRQEASLGPVLLRGLPDPGEVALQAEARLAGTGAAIVPGSARWIGDLSLRGTTSDHTLRMRLSPSGAGGRVLLSPKAQEPPAWAAPLEDWTPLTTEAESELTTLVDDVLRAAGIEATELRLVRYPQLRLQVEEDSTRHTVELDLRGGLEVSPGSSAISWRSRLLRLHLAHGSPGYRGPRWIWARSVDLMGLTMITWSLTGLVMWWKMPRLRRSGAIALGVGALTMGALSLTLWAVLGL